MRRVKKNMLSFLTTATDGACSEKRGSCATNNGKSDEVAPQRAVQRGVAIDSYFELTALRYVRLVQGRANLDSKFVNGSAVQRTKVCTAR
jgi:hypothetical protein